MTSEEKAREREAAMRLALAMVGCMPQTIDLLIERKRAWIEGEEDGE